MFLFFNQMNECKNEWKVISSKQLLLSWALWRWKDMCSFLKKSTYLTFEKYKGNPSRNTSLNALSRIMSIIQMNNKTVWIIFILVCKYLLGFFSLCLILMWSCPRMVVLLEANYISHPIKPTCSHWAGFGQSCCCSLEALAERKGGCKKQWNQGLKSEADV